MLVSHCKNVVVDIFPRMLRYTIPLYMNEERLHFGTDTLVLEVPRTPTVECAGGDNTGDRKLKGLSSPLNSFRPHPQQPLHQKTIFMS